MGYIAHLVRASHQVVVTHRNGLQVGIYYDAGGGGQGEGAVCAAKCGRGPVPGEHGII
jgi:carbamate kinase